MKFKVIKESNLFLHLSTLYVHMQAANLAADKLVKEFGADGYAPNHEKLAGGILAFTFPKEPPYPFKRLLTSSGNWYNIDFSSTERRHQRIYQQVVTLPVVSYEELHALLRYDQISVISAEGELAYLLPSVTVKWAKEYILIDVCDGVPYTPAGGMMSISISEYEMLEAAIK